MRSRIVRRRAFLAGLVAYIGFHYTLQLLLGHLVVNIIFGIAFIVITMELLKEEEKNASWQEFFAWVLLTLVVGFLAGLKRLFGRTK